MPAATDLDAVGIRARDLLGIAEHRAQRLLGRIAPAVADRLQDRFGLQAAFDKAVGPARSDALRGDRDGVGADGHRDRVRQVDIFAVGSRHSVFADRQELLRGGPVGRRHYWSFVTAGRGRRYRPGRSALVVLSRRLAGAEEEHRGQGSSQRPHAG